MGEGILPRASGRRKERLMGLLLPAFNKQFGYGPGDLRELTALLAGLGFGFALAHGDLLFAAFWRCHRNDGGRRRLVKGALAMSKVAVYIAFVLSTAWLLFGSWQPPQTVSGNHSGHEATNDYWQDAPRAPTTDEGETKVLRADGEQEE